eukprot:TRINITY_DN122_c0_g2_i1.p1 TRINITY_DN122_c0_g2~~TRINITY_DN122_c0_g2_i1.p1  ORF type:complete len:1068 (+),score=293.71 TRINITY_DN122_c0_g2_i1:397-3204(+)
MAKQFYMNDTVSLNPLSPAMLSSLHLYGLKYGTSTAVHSVILRNFGLAWSTGLDFVELANRTPEGRSEYLNEVAQTFADYNAWTKPLINISEGVISGAGCGLWMAGGIRVATDKTLISFNDCQGGLVPIGCTKHLSNMPRNFGIFLGLTGAVLDGKEMVACGLASHHMAEEYLKYIPNRFSQHGLYTTDAFLAAIMETADKDLDYQELTTKYDKDMEFIESAFGKETLDELIEELMGNTHSEFCQKASIVLATQDRATVELNFRLLKAAKNLTLEQSLLLEKQAAEILSSRPSFLQKWSTERTVTLDLEHHGLLNAGLSHVKINAILDSLTERRLDFYPYFHRIMQKNEDKKRRAEMEEPIDSWDQLIHKGFDFSDPRTRKLAYAPITSDYVGENNPFADKQEDPLKNLDLWSKGNEFDREKLFGQFAECAAPIANLLRFWTQRTGMEPIDSQLSHPASFEKVGGLDVEKAIQESQTWDAGKIISKQGPPFQKGYQTQLHQMRLEDMITHRCANEEISINSIRKAISCIPDSKYREDAFKNFDELCRQALLFKRSRILGDQMGDLEEKHAESIERARATIKVKMAKDVATLKRIKEFGIFTPNVYTNNLDELDVNGDENKVEDAPEEDDNMEGDLKMKQQEEAEDEEDGSDGLMEDGNLDDIANLVAYEPKPEDVDFYGEDGIKFNIAKEVEGLSYLHENEFYDEMNEVEEGSEVGGVRNENEDVEDQDDGEGGYEMQNGEGLFDSDERIPQVERFTDPDYYYDMEDPVWLYHEGIPLQQLLDRRDLSLNYYVRQAIYEEDEYNDFLEVDPEDDYRTSFDYENDAFDYRLYKEMQKEDEEDEGEGEEDENDIRDELANPMDKPEVMRLDAADFFGQLKGDEDPSEMNEQTITQADLRITPFKVIGKDATTIDEDEEIDPMEKRETKEGLPCNVQY